MASSSKNTNIPTSTTELVFGYEATPPLPITLPHEALIAEFGIEKLPPELVRDSRYIQAELGARYAQELWINAVEGYPSLPAALKRRVAAWRASLLMLEKDQDGNILGTTDKALVLVRLLLAALEIGNLKCLLFVRERVLASHMKGFLQAALNHVMIGIDVVPGGSWNAEAQAILDKFERGGTHILIVPRDAEDVNLSLASTIIRFDVDESQVSYLWIRNCIQSQGTIVQLMESGHDHHVLALRQSATVSGSLTTWASQLRSKVRVPSPPAALHEGPQPSLDPSSLDMCIEDPVTGGRINPAQAVRVILWLASTLGQRQPDVSDTTLLSYRTSGTQYLCTVQLPSILLSPVTSQPCLNLTQARRDACFHACTQLHQQGLLGTRLFQPPPEIYLVPHTPLPAHASKYSRKAPLFWDRCLKTSGLVLFPTLLYFDKEGNQHPSCRFGTDASRLLILTRQPLPSLQRFCTYQWGPRSHRLDAYRAGLIRGASFDVTPEQMDALYHFTLRSWRMVSNKRLVCALDQMPYLIAPLTSDIQATSSTTPTSPLPTFHESILWKEIEAAATVATMPFTLADLDKDVTDFIVQDRSAELTKRYLVKKIRRDLSPLSKPDAYSREADFASYLESARKHSQRFEYITDEHQPLLEIEELPTTLNALSPHSKSSGTSDSLSLKPVKYLIPQLCFRLTTSARTFKALLFLPAVIERISLQLLALELNTSLFGCSVDDDHLFSSLVTKSAVMDVNYDRLECLGDVYIKYLTSAYLFLIEPNCSENAMHRMRSDIVSNKTLKACAEKTGLTGFIHTKGFASKLWQPKNSIVLPDPPKGEREASGLDDLAFDLSRTPVPTAASGRPPPTNDTALQHIGDKVVADVVEAVIGAAFLTGGHPTAVKVVHALQLPMPHLHRLGDLKQRLFKQAAAHHSKLSSATVEGVERIAGSKITRLMFLEHALNPVSSLRLRFVGEALLDLLLAHHIFTKHEHYAPGTISLLKGAMMSNATLAAICVRLGLHKYVYNVTPPVQHAIDTYANKVEHARRQQGKAVQSSGQYWTGLNPPKILSDMLNSLVATLYLSDDCQMNDAVRCFVEQTLLPIYDAHVTVAMLDIHPTRILCEYVQRQGCSCLRFENIRGSGREMSCNIFLHSNVLSGGTARTLQLAAREASAKGVQVLERLPTWLPEMCDCQTRADNPKAHKKALRDMLKNFANDDTSVDDMMPL